VISITASPLSGPFFREGNSTAVLFIHGFSATPSELYPVALQLHATKGYTVKGPLLPGHGSLPEELNHTVWTDWYETVEEEMHNLRAQYDKVVLAGLSMGALLALHAGCRLEGINAVAAINAPIYNRQPWLTLLAPVIQYIKPYFPKKMDETRARLEEEGRFAYNVTPVQAFRSMMKLRGIVMRELDRLTAPLLVIQSLQDQSVRTESADYIMKHATRCRACLLKLPRSGHIATMGPEKDIIVQSIIKLADG
jgi:carboxylesterase